MIKQFHLLAPAFLNRQIIVLLENMGVKKDIFLQLQNKAQLRISMSLLANRSAQRTLEQHIRCYNWDRMRTSGFRLTDEPFCRQLLLLLAQDRLKHLKEKAHVSIPFSDGRMLLGVVDETGSLRYGQVFIQLREQGDSVIVKDRKVLITKNPAHFPGDIRKLDAVDCPALHHLYECVVFPTEGPRPHPNEISGSDTDGDEVSLPVYY
jgi:RNA-dependent RNA polymerase